MTATLERGVLAVGSPLDRVDGPQKVTGAARYPTETPVAGALYGVVVQSTIARGRIVTIDEAEARAVPGVVEIMSFRNAPRVVELSFSFATPMPEALAPLQTDAIRYDGQHVAVVIAQTFEAAREAALLLRVEYEAAPHVATVTAETEFERPEVWFGSDAQPRRGEPEDAFAASDVQLDVTYATPLEHHNPLEPSGSLAYWEGDDLVVHDSTQGVYAARACLAKAFEIDEERVRVIATYVGGGFGCKGWFWAHPLLAAMAARLTGRPVKLTLTREQMF
ncbi:MAG: xanthine dehydrogenase family protein molybdopterin-binding subunit, partial [Candidatus Eremiobacteraeota bacterium]|nr:xanthine dehydrogenase family protein molybdopterin-binding subunit [Candidatus Eremiobacteraeota bacterium]